MNFKGDFFLGHPVLGTIYQRVALSYISFLTFDVVFPYIGDVFVALAAILSVPFPLQARGI